MVVRQTVVVVVKVGGQVANIAFWQGIRNAVVVQIVKHRQGEGKELAVDRVVGPNREVHRLGCVGGRTADAAVHHGVSSRAPAEGQAFGQFANKFPGDHVTAAVDPRQERVHGLVHEEVDVLGRVLKRERQVEVGVQRVAQAITVGVGRRAEFIQRVGATGAFVKVAPRVVVVVKVLDQRRNAGGRSTGHQRVGLTVVVGVLGTGGVKREGVGSSHAATVGRRFRTVAHTVAVRVRIVRLGAERCTEFGDVLDTVAVHIVVHQVADAVAVHVLGDAGGVERVALTGHFGRVQVAVVVVVVVSDEATRTVGVLVGVSVAVGVDRQGRVERVAVRAGVANAFNAQVSITEAVAVRVRVVRVGPDDALVGVGQAVVVVVLVFDEGVGLLARVGVVVGQLVGHAVAVKVLEHLKPERGFNREGRVGRVRPNRVGRVVHRLGRRSTDDTRTAVEDQAVGQVGRQLPRGAGNGVGRVDRRRFGVVDQDGWTKRARTHRVGVRTGQTNRWHGVGAVADAVTVRVGVEGIRTEVAGTVVDARARFRQVGCTVTVVVQVLDQLTVFGIVLGQFVGQTVAVGVLQDLEVEGEEQAASRGVAVHRVFRFRDDFGRRTADDTGDGVNGDTRRQSGVDFVGAIGDGVLRRERNHQRVVERIDGTFSRLTQRRLVRTGHTDGRHGVGTVANTVVVGVGVKRVGTRVGAAVVDARARFVHVVQAVTVVVLVFHQRWNAG